jgi:phage baseplate assembly protein W
VLRQQRNDQLLEELGRVYVVDALRRWEPRISVTSVQIGRVQHDGVNVLELRVRYDVVSTNVPGNNIILSELEQLIAVPTAIA